jgi:hypothetical protein
MSSRQRRVMAAVVAMVPPFGAVPARLFVWSGSAHVGLGGCPEFR